MITNRARLGLAAIGAGLLAAGIVAALTQTTAAGAVATPVPSITASDVPWCTSEAPPSTTPGGPSYLPQCPGPYVSPSGPAASGVPVWRPPTRSPRWLPPANPSASPTAAGCRTVQDWRTVSAHRYRVLLCGTGAAEHLVLQAS